MFNLSTYGKTEQEAQATSDNLKQAADDLIAQIKARKAKEGNRPYRRDRSGTGCWMGR